MENTLGRTRDNNMREDKLFTVREVAERFNVHPATVKNWIKSKNLACYKFMSKTIRISQEQITEYEQNNRCDIISEKQSTDTGKQDGRDQTDGHHATLSTLKTKHWQRNA